ncbi:MAG: hypothetical protein M3Y43_07725 [Pseudomonadota bacterium]|nr:hypothetical protein [Pseudomonadota bacterium]
MLRELSEDVRIRVKDGLRDFRSIVRQHRHDRTPGKPASAEPFPVREIEGLLGHAVSAFDDVMTLAESFAPHRSASIAVSGPQPLQSYFRARGGSRLDGERAFRRDLYRLAKLVLEQKKLDAFRIRESDFAAVHEALEKRDAGLIARLHAEPARDGRLALVAALSSSLFVELVRHEPIKLPTSAADGRETIDIGHVIAVNCLAAIAIACGLATLDMEGAAGPELMEIAVLAVDARSDRIRSALDRADPVNELTPLFAGLLTHLN